MEYKIKTRKEAFNLLRGIAASIAQQEVDAAQIIAQFDIHPDVVDYLIKKAIMLAMQKYVDGLFDEEEE